MEIQKVKWAFFLLGLVFIVGVGGYMVIEGWGFFDSLYMVIITLATVGFAEVHPLSFEGRLFTLFVIIFGAVIGFYAVSNVIKPIIEGEIRKVFGRRKLEKEIKSLKNHYLICGFGRIGS